MSKFFDSKKATWATVLDIVSDYGFVLVAVIDLICERYLSAIFFILMAIYFEIVLRGDKGED